jgi:hypothetical protein
VPPIPKANQEMLQALATLFEKQLKTPKGRKEFFSDPSIARELGLPASAVNHLTDLSYDELRLLAQTWQAMQRAKLTYDVGGVRVSFL